VSVITRLRRLAQSVLGSRDAATTEADRKLERAAARDAHRQQKQAARRERVGRQRADRGALSVDGEVSTVALDYPRHDIRLLASSRMEREWRARSCAKEPWTVAWLEASMPEGGVLYDIGANTGAFSLVAAKIGGPGTTVVAFEPGYASFARLCENIVLNGCQDVIFPVPLALGEATGVATLRYNTLHPGQSRHRFVEHAWMRAGADNQPILAISLDALVEQFSLPPPRHVKLDVDGAELSVLRGAARTLVSPGLASILIEIDDSLSGAVTALLEASGFRLDERHKREQGEATRVWYGVFRR
jgi:FkbM family methyltransferase